MLDERKAVARRPRLPTFTSPVCWLRLWERSGQWKIDDLIREEEQQEQQRPLSPESSPRTTPAPASALARSPRTSRLAGLLAQAVFLPSAFSLQPSAWLPVCVLFLPDVAPSADRFPHSFIDRTSALLLVLLGPALKRLEAPPQAALACRNPWESPVRAQHPPSPVPAALRALRVSRPGSSHLTSAATFIQVLSPVQIARLRAAAGTRIGDCLSGNGVALCPTDGRL